MRPVGRGVDDVADLNEAEQANILEGLRRVRSSPVDQLLDTLYRRRRTVPIERAWEEYLPALRRADRGELDPLVAFAQS